MAPRQSQQPSLGQELTNLSTWASDRTRRAIYGSSSSAVSSSIPLLSNTRRRHPARPQTPHTPPRRIENTPEDAATSTSDNDSTTANASSSSSHNESDSDTDIGFEILPPPTPHNPIPTHTTVPAVGALQNAAGIALVVAKSFGSVAMEMARRVVPLDVPTARVPRLLFLTGGGGANEGYGENGMRERMRDVGAGVRSTVVREVGDRGGRVGVYGDAIGERSWESSERVSHPRDACEGANLDDVAIMDSITFREATLGRMERVDSGEVRGEVGGMVRWKGKERMREESDGGGDEGEGDEEELEGVGVSDWSDEEEEEEEEAHNDNGSPSISPTNTNTNTTSNPLASTSTTPFTNIPLSPPASKSRKRRDSSRKTDTCNAARVRAEAGRAVQEMQEEVWRIRAQAAREMAEEAEREREEGF